MEELTDSFTFVRCHRHDINKSFNVRVPAAPSRDDRTPVSVPHQHHRPGYPLKGSSNGCNIVRERGQWTLHGDNWYSSPLEEWDFEALLRWFKAADLLSSGDVANLWRQWGESVQARQVVEAMRELRERLRKEVVTREQGGAVHRSAIDELNRLMAEHPMLTRLKASGSAPTTALWFDPRRPEDLFAPPAHSAATLFARFGSQPRA